MAFNLSNWTCVSTSLSQPQLSAPVFPGTEPVIQNAPNLYTYGSSVDTAAQIAASNYFLPQYASLGVGDIIIGFGTDASFMLQVLTSTSTGVTTESFTSTGSIGTANIVNNAVTYPKLQQASVGNVVLANPTGSAASYQETTLTNGLAFTGTTLGLSNTYLRLATFTLSATQFNGMYATPVQVIAAPGAGLMHMVDSVALNLTYGSAQFAAGGAVGLQYGNTAHLAGTAASVTEAATDFTAAAANTMFRFGAGLSTGALTSTAINAAVYISNATQAFTTGTGGSFAGFVWYKTVSAT